MNTTNYNGKECELIHVTGELYTVIQFMRGKFAANMESKKAAIENGKVKLANKHGEYIFVSDEINTSSELKGLFINGVEIKSFVCCMNISNEIAVYENVNGAINVVPFDVEKDATDYIKDNYL